MRHTGLVPTARERAEEEALADAQASRDFWHKDACRQAALVRRLEEQLGLQVSVADAVLAYDRAIESCANDRAKMSSFCSAQGDDLDALYLKMITVARAVGGTK